MNSKAIMDIYEESLELHKKLKGKIETTSKMKITSKHDLSLAYTPGVARACEEIAKDKEKAKELTIKNNTVAVITDGSAVLGLGNIGAEASLPVMEGKALLFKEYADVNAFPICLNTQDTEEIITTIKRIAPVFGGINLEDISAPRCFMIEERLQDLGIPVFHDDQHGTAIVVLAGLINAAKLQNKTLADLKIVINGSGAAGIAIAKLLICMNQDRDVCIPVKDIIICDSKGIIQTSNPNPAKQLLAHNSNKNNVQGGLKEAMIGADVFIGVSKGNLLNEEMIKTMTPEPIIFALANPIPEVMPDDAKKWGAKIIATGRSDFPNQVNNVLAFPGIFKGALQASATKITEKMKIMAAYALARAVENPTYDMIVPSPLDKTVADIVADAVKKCV